MGVRELVVDGRVVVVHVRESHRARTMRLVVAPGRPPEVVVPARGRRRDVEHFLHTQRDWLARTLAARDAAARRPRVLPERPGSVWLAGQPVPVEHGRTGRRGAALHGGRLLISGAPSDTAASVDRWYRREARRRLTESVDRQAPGLGVRAAAISVRDQRTRWGSCSHQGRLSFSWRLVLAPPEVLDYVVLHELCHLRELNHSRAFWRLVGSVRPDWRDAAGWLRAHGHELHTYRPDRGLDATTSATADLRAAGESGRP